MYLVDTNVFLEVFLRRSHSSEVKKFLRQTPYNDLYVTDLSLETLGFLLFKHGMYQAYTHFLKDLFADGEVWRIQLVVENMQKVGDVARKFNLNYHDAYQYVAADMYNLTIISYNPIFNQTEKGYKQPGDFVQDEGLM